MIDMKTLNIQYITNDSGECISVVLPIDKFEELLEDMNDLATMAERQAEPTICHKQLIQELKTDGLL